MQIEVGCLLTKKRNDFFYLTIRPTVLQNKEQCIIIFKKCDLLNFAILLQKFYEKLNESN